MPHYLGIEIGGSKPQVLLTREDLKPIESFRFKIEKSSGASGIKTSIVKCLQEMVQAGRSIPVAMRPGSDKS